VAFRSARISRCQSDYEGEWNPLWEFYFYAINGQRLVMIDCNNPNANYQPNCWVVGENVHFGKRLLVSNGVYVATDRLGTVRANTQGESFAYYPFGEERTNRPDGRDKFATYFRDGVGQDYARQRYYNASLGRFWSVDPGGIKTAHPSNPTSWNRYAYVNGDPINFNDPRGLDTTCAPGYFWTGEGCDPGSGDGDAGSTAENYSDTGDTGTTADQGDEDETSDTTPEPADPTPAQPCAADTCITVTGTLALVPYVTSTLTTELVPGVFDTVVDFIGGFVGFIVAGASNLFTVPAAILATPTATGCETRTPCANIPMTVQWVETNCTPVGPPVIVPSTKRGNRGGQSIEQEYLCPDGNNYTVHILTNLQGNPIEQHVRPGPPKYGPPPGVVK
jgi:RHS repeat-associated protein